MTNPSATLWITFAAGVFVPALAHAQVTTKSTLIEAVSVACSIGGPMDAVCTCRDVDHCTTAADQLSDLADKGTTAQLVTYLGKVAASAGRDGHVRFVWEGTDADGNPIARSVLYDAGKRAIAASLPGTARQARESPDYVDVLVTHLVATTMDGTPPARADLAKLPVLRTRYTSTKENNPILEQVPALIAKMALPEFVAARAGTSTLPAAKAAGVEPALPVEPQPRPFTVFKVYLPDLPYARATIVVHDSIVTPPAFSTISGSATRAAARLRYSFQRVSTCAVNLADAYAGAIQAGKSDCGPDGGVVAGVEACQSALKTGVTAARKETLESQSKCPHDVGSIGTDPVAAVDKRFNDLVDTLASVEAKGESKIRNTPRERVSFGLMTAVRFGDPAFSGVRTTVGNDGKVVEDPLPRLVTAVLVNYHPWGYDPSLILTWKDPGSIRLFAGTALSPDFGLVLGAAYSPLKGLAINLGYAMLLTNTPKAGVELGKEVPSAFSNDPFEMGRARSWIWGLSYSFQ